MSNKNLHKLILELTEFGRKNLTTTAVLMMKHEQIYVCFLEFRLIKTFYENNYLYANGIKLNYCTHSFIYINLNICNWFAKYSHRQDWIRIRIFWKILCISKRTILKSLFAKTRLWSAANDSSGSTSMTCISFLSSKVFLKWLSK